MTGLFFFIQMLYQSKTMTSNNPRHLMDLEIQPIRFLPSFTFKTVEPGDVEALGELLWNADQDLERYKENTLAQSIEEVQEILDGKSGPFLNECSFVIVEQDLHVAAVLFTFYPKEGMPLLALTMTRRSHKNRGLCQSLLKLANNVLFSKGYRKCFLAVDADNPSAIRAYEKVGFLKRYHAEGRYERDK